MVKTIFEITVDGGTPYTLDMNTHAAAGAGSGLWFTVTGGIAIPINAEFNTSILIRAKNDTDTNQIAVSISASEDQ